MKEIENKLVKKGAKNATLGLWREQAGDKRGNTEGVGGMSVSLWVEKGSLGEVTFELRCEM